jgi:hypothetical protein
MSRQFSLANTLLHFLSPRIAWLAAAVYTCALVYSLFGADREKAAGFGKEVETFTGGHTRVVWVVDADRNKDVFTQSNLLRLMGFDSRDDKGTRTILESLSNYYRPLLTPDGEQIVFTNRSECRTYVVNWDGSGLRVLKENAAAAAVWRDPKSGETWVYAQKSATDTNAPVIRFLLATPAREEVVWSGSPIETLPGNFQLSRDGTRASAAFPWPQCGVAMLPTISWKKQTNGCWPSLAPDNSYLSWTFDGSHRDVFMTQLDSGKSWTVRLSNAPGVSDYEIYHPRWTNNVNYVVMTGPYSMGQDAIKLWSGAAGVEIYIGKFSADFTRIESWLKLTDSTQGEFFPDVWIEGGEKVSVVSEPGPPSVLKHKETASEGETWPGPVNGLVFLWKDNVDANEFVDYRNVKHNVRVNAVGGSRYGPAGQMHLVNGAFVPQPDFGESLQQAFRETGEFSFEAIITFARPFQQPPAEILSLARKNNTPFLALIQDGSQLVLLLRSTGSERRRIELGVVSANRPSHVLLAYRDGEVFYYRDGHLTSRARIEKVNFDKWKEGNVVFGSRSGSRWVGWLDSIAIYNRFIDVSAAAERATLAGLRIANRPMIPRINVNAMLLGKEAPPSPDSIAPYRRALVINRYTITEAQEANLVGKTVQVAEWALLDGKTPASYAKVKPGDSVYLELESFDSHPQLESERLLSIPSLEEALYYNVISGW